MLNLVDLVITTIKLPSAVTNPATQSGSRLNLFSACPLTTSTPLLSDDPIDSINWGIDTDPIAPVVSGNAFFKTSDNPRFKEAFKLTASSNPSGVV
jgi:hypothetical protein